MNERRSKLFKLERKHPAMFGVVYTTTVFIVWVYIFWKYCGGAIEI